MRCLARRIAPRPDRRVAATLALAAALLLVGGAGQAATPAAFVAESVAGAVLAGKGQLRVMGLRIYDARLWVGPGFQAADFAAHPFALELTYLRAFTGKAIAQRSIDEMQRQAAIPTPQAEQWRQQLAALMPDVQAGDRVTGVYRPGQGMRLWRGGNPLGAIEDAELASRFFGIWLSPATSDRALRQALLARHEGRAP